MRAFIFIFLFSWICTLFLPWWTLFVPSILIAAWLIRSAPVAFLTGFAASGMPWFLQALYIHILNDAILSTRIAEMLGAESAWIVLLLTFITGGIPGGLGALTGCLLMLSLPSAHGNKTVQTSTTN